VGSIHPLPHTPSCRSALLVKHRDNFTLRLVIYVLVFIYVFIALFNNVKTEIAQSVKRRATGWTAGATDLSLLHSVQTGSRPIQPPTQCDVAFPRW
jgi:hypothetical protein